jgi:hypothetical protein
MGGGDGQARNRRSARFFETNDSPPAVGRDDGWFGSTTEHLASEVIAAYVDGELRMSAYLRAAQHLSLCPECAAEVDAQRQASGALRRAAHISMPSNLLGALSQIPGEHTPGCPPEFDINAVIKRWTQWWRR